MPFTVITLTNAPFKLRGDLSRWMQEIATGVYVGNINSKIRELLWNRVITMIKDGQATISYSSKNELGYQFEMFNSSRRSMDYDGLNLVYFLFERDEELLSKSGFSNASKIQKIKKYSNLKSKHNVSDLIKYVVLDIETSGLNIQTDEIIEIGAIKVNGNSIEEFHKLIKPNKPISIKISELTGISNALLNKSGSEISEALKQLKDFVEDYIIIGYNINFDMLFINKELRKLKLQTLNNNIKDLMALVKKNKPLLSDYTLSTVVNEYNIRGKVAHRAIQDVYLIKDLLSKVNENM